MTDIWSVLHFSGFPVFQCYKMNTRVKKKKKPKPKLKLYRCNSVNSVSNNLKYPIILGESDISSIYFKANVSCHTRLHLL